MTATPTGVIPGSQMRHAQFPNASCPAPTGHLPSYLPAVCTEKRPLTAFELYIQMPFRPSRSLSRTVCTENRHYSAFQLYIQFGCGVLNVGQMAVGGQDSCFVLAKTEIAVFGPEQNHPARGGERFRRIFARARAPASTGTRKCHYFDRPRAGSPSQRVNKSTINKISPRHHHPLLCQCQKKSSIPFGNRKLDINTYFPRSDSVFFMSAKL